jgi:hypothetical protein
VFFVLVLGMVIWSGFYTLEVVALDRGLKVFFAQAKYAGISLVPISWLFFTAAFTGKSWATSRRLMWVLGIMPFITGVLAMTNEWHGIVWEQGAAVITSTPFPSYQPTLNLWFWVHTAYSYSMFLVGMVLVAGQIRQTDVLKRRQAMIMFVGIGVAFSLNIVSVLAANPLNNLDLSPVGFVVAVFSFSWVLLRLQLMDFIGVESAALPMLEIESDVQSILEQNRVGSFEILIKGTMLLGGIAVLGKWIQVLRSPVALPEFWLFLGAYAGIITLYFAKNLPYNIRAGGFVVIWYLFSLISALLTGIDLTMGLTLVGFCVFTFSLWGLLFLQCY